MVAFFYVKLKVQRKPNETWYLRKVTPKLVAVSVDVGARLPVYAICDSPFPKQY